MTIEKISLDRRFNGKKQNYYYYYYYHTVDCMYVGQGYGRYNQTDQPGETVIRLHEQAITR
jgi:hypothetical protein